ncbi:resact receptor-like [Anneissia japonica]|uniref:resact receptor-like n=1 Tax=Anneissia japonica TaxID=1529436 RepID=UPI00142593D0|nr:resact receptor-like [Anneissia japonica]
MSTSSLTLCIICATLQALFFNYKIVFAEEFKLGFIHSHTAIVTDDAVYEGSAIAGAFVKAINDINQSPGVLPNSTLTWVWEDTKCDVSTSLTSISSMWVDDIVGFIGTGCTCDYESHVSSAIGLPLIDYACNVEPDGAEEVDVHTPELFVSLLPRRKYVAYSIIKLMDRYNWKKVTLVARDDTVWLETMWFTRDLLNINQMNINDIIIYATEPSPQGCEQNDDATVREARRYICSMKNEMKRLIRNSCRQTRIYVFFGEPWELRIFLLAASSEAILDTGEYVIIGSVIDYYERNEQDFHGIHYFGIDDGEDTRAKLAFESLLLLTPHVAPNLAYTTFKEEVANISQAEPFNSPYTMDIACNSLVDEYQIIKLC